jgi:flagellar biosynthetic protein FliS
MGINAYAAVNNMVEEEDKCTILLKVLQGVIDKCDIIKGAIEQKDYEKKYTEVSKVAMIIQVLDSSLDMNQGEVPEKLSSLYNYLLKRLAQLHAKPDMKIVSECRSIFCNIMDGFVQAGQIERKKSPHQIRPDSKYA